MMPATGKRGSTARTSLPPTSPSLPPSSPSLPPTGHSQQVGRPAKWSAKWSGKQEVTERYAIRSAEVCPRGLLITRKGTPKMRKLTKKLLTRSLRRKVTMWRRAEAGPREASRRFLRKSRRFSTMIPRRYRSIRLPSSRSSPRRCLRPSRCASSTAPRCPRKCATTSRSAGTSPRRYATRSRSATRCPTSGASVPPRAGVLGRAQGGVPPGAGGLPGSPQAGQDCAPPGLPHGAQGEVPLRAQAVLHPGAPPQVQEGGRAEVLRGAAPEVREDPRGEVLDCSSPDLLQDAPPGVHPGAPPEVLQGPRAEVLDSAQPEVLQDSCRAVLAGAGAEVLAGAEGGVLGRDHQGGEEGLRAAQVVIRPGQPPCGSIV